MLRTNLSVVADMTLGSHQSARSQATVYITPKWIIDALGGAEGFDLDVCDATVRPWPCAQHNFTEIDNGLEREWFGFTWCNPPFDSDVVGVWVERMARHGNGILLVHVRSETAWFEVIWQHATAILFLADRLFFHLPDGSRCPHNSGAPACLVAFGASAHERLRACIGMPGRSPAIIQPIPTTTQKEEATMPDKLKAVETSNQSEPAADTAKPDSEQLSIAKPSAFDIKRFQSKSAAALANVETLQTALAHHKISEAKDFVRLHPNEETHWSPELCFANVPIKGQKRDTLHLIKEDLAVHYLPPKRILRFRLALATKPYDVFFLCHIPTRNDYNTWNTSNVQACEQAKAFWVQVTSRKDEGYETYKIDFARNQDAFPDPKWPTQSLFELIITTFTGRMIEANDHPGLLRLIGAKQT
jgi:hypothetical protein